MSNAQKVLTVATAVQKAVMEKVLLAEIATGFWKNARPADHADYWKGVEIKVGTVLGASGGLEIPRNYNFVNPTFTAKSLKAMLDAAHTADPALTENALKKQLLSLNQIIGGRLVEIGGEVKKLPRGRKNTTEATEVKETKTTSTTTRRAAVNFAAEPAAEKTEDQAA